MDHIYGSDICRFQRSWTEYCSSDSFPEYDLLDEAYGLAPTQAGLSINSGTSTTGVYNYGFIYKVDSSGTLIDSIATGLGESQGLAWDGTYYWYIQRRGVATFRLFKVTTAGAVIDSIIPPSAWYLGGAGWDGTGLWVSVYYPNTDAALYKYNISTKTIIDTVHTLGIQPQGIAWDGQYLYYVIDNNDNDPEKIYQVNLATRDTVRSWYLTEGPSSNMSPRGLAWDGGFLWLIAEPAGASSGRVLYKYDLGGNGTPDINLPTSLVDFGEVRINQQRTISIAVQNVGTAPLRVDSVKVMLSTHFTSLLFTPATITAGSSLQLPLVFLPTTFGPDTTSIIVYSNDPDEATKIVAAHGMGIYSSSFIATPAGNDFGARRVGSTNSWKMAIQNQGGGQLSVSSITVANPAFSVDSIQYPILLDSLQTTSVRIWFHPSSILPVLDTLRITSDASNGPVTRVTLRGTGDATPIPIGTPIWTYTVPDHPISNTFRLVKAVRAMNDITGDGKSDVIVSTDNYWTMALNGNSSQSNDSLWAFSTYISSFSAGSIGSTGDYSHQKALGIASDLNDDGFNDVVIGTGGGNEHVYALNGKTGHVLWTFGTDDPDSFSLGDFTGVDVSTDFNSDGVPDVIAAAAASESGGIGGRRTVYLFNGTNGNIIWQAPLLGFTHGVAAIQDVNGDLHPDVVGTVGEPSYLARAFNGTNGATLWSFPVPSASGGAKEVMSFPVPGQANDVIMGAFWGPVYRLHGATGAEVWSHPTGGVGGGGVMQLYLLRDVTGDGIDEVLVALLGNGALCLNGATGATVWSIPTGNTMGIASIPDLNQDTYDEAVVASQSQGAIIVRGQDGVQLGVYSFGANETREVAVVPDMDGNYSREVIAGSKFGDIALISGGLNAGPNSVEEQSPLPKQFSLEQNFPNPFNPSTTIQIKLPEQSDLRLTIFDLLGREIRSFEYEKVPRGSHQVVWDGKDERGMQVASGVYFYRLDQKSALPGSGWTFIDTKKLMFIK